MPNLWPRGRTAASLSRNELLLVEPVSLAIPHFGFGAEGVGNDMVKILIGVVMETGK